MPLFHVYHSETCPLEYQIIDPNHSFCVHTFPGAIEQRLTHVEQMQIIQMHNDERRLVHATNMEQMV
jgi:hypothetical protein